MTQSSDHQIRRDVSARCMAPRDTGPSPASSPCEGPQPSPPWPASVPPPSQHGQGPDPQRRHTQRLAAVGVDHLAESTRRRQVRHHQGAGASWSPLNWPCSSTTTAVWSPSAATGGRTEVPAGSVGVDAARRSLRGASRRRCSAALKRLRCNEAHLPGCCGGVRSLSDGGARG